MASSRPTISCTARSGGTSLGRVGADETPVAQHGDAVGYTIDLLHPMADEHHGDVLRAQVVDDAEQPLDFAARQRRRRLVHDQHAGVDRQRPGDLDELLLGTAQAAEDLVGRATQADDLQERRCPIIDLRPVEIAEAIPGRMAHEDVLGDGKVGEEAGMLVHDRDAAVQRIDGGTQHHRCAVDRHMARVGPVHAGQHLDAGALAGAVLAEQGQHLASPQLERDVADRKDTAESLGDMIEAHNHVGGRHRKCLDHTCRCGCRRTGHERFQALSRSLP